jgi:predicted amidohydrolase
MNLYQLENQFLSAGTEPVTFESPFGKIGLLICADVYSFQPLEAYRRAGVKVLSLSTSWAQMNTGMGYFKRAAQQLGAYLLAANQPYYPDSGVVNPDGSNQSHIRQTTTGIAYGYLPRVVSSTQGRQGQAQR